LKVRAWKKAEKAADRDKQSRPLAPKKTNAKKTTAKKTAAKKKS
jgi:hypothetical protein